MSELVDERGLEPRAETRRGSIPLSGTIPYDRISAPYGRYDGRRQVDVWINGVKSARLYSRAQMEMSLGRFLSWSDHVHHIDGDETNDDIANLAVIDISAHAAMHAFRRVSADVKCVWCDTEFSIPGNILRRREAGKAGPFCSRECSGEYGALLQNGYVGKIPPPIFTREYVRLDGTKKG